MNKRDIFQEAIDSISPVTKSLVKIQSEIAILVDELLKSKNITKNELAKRMGVKPSYVSRILYGGTNLTLKTIAKLEIALDEEIITIPINSNRSWFNLHFQNSQLENSFIHVVNNREEWVIAENPVEHFEKYLEEIVEKNDKYLNVSNF